MPLLPGQPIVLLSSAVVFNSCEAWSGGVQHGWGREGVLPGSVFSHSLERNRVLSAVSFMSLLPKQLFFVKCVKIQCYLFACF